jgi:arginase
VAAANRRLADKVAEVVNNGDFPLVLGGDHSIAIGTIAGLGSHYKNMGVIWFDAHADINTPVTSPSGNIHGMPLAASLGLGHPELVDIGGFRGKIKSENIVMIGVRDIDEGERLFIEKEQIKNYTVEDIKRLGIKQVIQETVEYLSVRCDGIHLSFDIDGLDPTDMPGVGTPVTKGITYDDGLEIVKLLFAANILTSAEVVELNPLLDESGHTVRATVNLLGALFGVSEQVPLQQGRYVFQNNMTHS